MDLTLQAGETGDGGGVQMDAWMMSRLGFALDTYIDREINKPQLVYDQSQAYGVADDGTLYTLGRPASRVGAVGGGVNSTLLLVGIVLLVVLASK